MRTTAGIIFGRLLLVPPTGLGIVMLADKLGFLPPGDKMFRFVLLLQHTMPTSVLSGNNPYISFTLIFQQILCQSWEGKFFTAKITIHCKKQHFSILKNPSISTYQERERGINILSNVYYVLAPSQIKSNVLMFFPFEPSKSGVASLF